MRFSVLHTRETDLSLEITFPLCALSSVSSVPLGTLSFEVKSHLYTKPPKTPDESWKETGVLAFI